MSASSRTTRPRRALGWWAALASALLACLTLAACGASTASTSASTAQSADSAGAAGAHTLVVMGASDAYGIGTYDPDRDNWPTQLAAALPQPTHLVNLGIPGATLAQAQQEELPVAVAQHARIVVLWLAVNDITDDVPLTTYIAQLHATLQTLRRESPASHVFVGNVPDLTRLPFFDGRDPASLRAQVDAWNAAIADTCASEGATLADLASAWGQFNEHPEYVSEDGLHPSVEGARALADFFDIVIRRTLRING
ncbi:MAG TPA: SGNH/GDSL hydrolase family protein [Ktedonobacterales bacterium]